MSGSSGGGGGGGGGHTTAADTTAAPLATTSEDDKYADCTEHGDNCAEKKCCKEPGHQCFRKSEFWSECRPECEKGFHLTDPDDTPWTCDVLGDKTPGEPKTCSKDGDDCRETQCCEEPGLQCYEKAEFWAACKPSCVPGPDVMAPDSDLWSCKEIGPRTPGAAPWVAEKCSHQNEDCRETTCCTDAGFQCYAKDDWFATCKSECNAGWKEHEWDTAWSCDILGPKTPRSGNPADQPKGQIQPWTAEKCLGEGENCVDTQCCKSVGWQCFTKNDYWAQCLYECPPGAPPAAAPTARRLGEAAPAAPAAPAPPAETWECRAMGPQSWGLSIKGYPSLYCLSLFLPTSYEGEIMNKQLERNAGIFACDGFEVIAADDVTLGTSGDGVLVRTQVIEKIEVGVSQDGTAGNAKLFMAMWDAIIAAKRFRDYDWTIKADPDAVLIPWRLRGKMGPHVGENVYVVNCNKFPSSPNFPMMFGSVEIFSSAAMIAYADGSWKCGQDLPWDSWGEDYYMTHCLDYLGVGRLSDFTVVGDDVCTGAMNCEAGDLGSFHPFKTVDDWESCWDRANPS